MEEEEENFILTILQCLSTYNTNHSQSDSTTPEQIPTQPETIPPPTNQATNQEQLTHVMDLLFNSANEISNNNYISSRDTTTYASIPHASIPYAPITYASIPSSSIPYAIQDVVYSYLNSFANRYINTSLYDENSANKKICIEENQLVLYTYKSTDDETRQLNCPITHTPFNDGDEITSLPCNHLFDTEAINKWVQKKPECPICRFKLKIIEQDQEQEETQESAILSSAATRAARRSIEQAQAQADTQAQAQAEQAQVEPQAQVQAEQARERDIDDNETYIDPMSSRMLFAFYDISGGEADDDDQQLQLSLIQSFVSLSEML